MSACEYCYSDPCDCYFPSVEEMAARISPEPLKVGALFAGYGGIELALASVLDTEPAWFSEFDKAPSAILAHHWPDVPNLGDVTKIDWAAVEPVDIITGGSPCQDLSHAGKRAGMKAGTRSGLWASMCDAIDIIRPRLVVWENVRGALSAEATSSVEPCPICVGDGGRVSLSRNSAPPPWARSSPTPPRSVRRERPHGRAAGTDVPDLHRRPAHRTRPLLPKVPLLLRPRGVPRVRALPAQAAAPARGARPICPAARHVGVGPARGVDVDRQAVKPPFTYYGGKTTLADKIVATLPEHSHYVEPFAGSLAVLLAKPRSDMETVNDLDRDLMTFWQVLRDRPADLERAMLLTPHSRAGHEAAYDLDVTDDLERARRVWVLLSQGRGSTLRKTGWRFYRDPAGSTYSMPDYLTAYSERVPAAAARLHGVSLECRDALEVIRDYGKHPNVLLYCDPPYVATSRNSTNYRHEMASDKQHAELAEALHSVEASVVLSGYGSQLYDDLFGDWSRIEMSAWTGNGIRDGATKTDGQRVEVLWSNRPLAAPNLLDLIGDQEKTA